MTIRIATIVFALWAIGAGAPCQNKTLLFFPRYDSTSTDTAALGRLGSLRPFDLTAVTPAGNASAHPLLPAAGFSALFGDADNDGSFAEFSGLPDASWGLGAPFVRWDDKPSGDPRLVYWTIREPALGAPTITLFNNLTTIHTMRVGDWVRITESGEAEFFIKQEQFVKAAGAQAGVFVAGATAICQAANKDIYYCPAHGVSSANQIAGGHYVSDGTNQVFAFDGAICRIPASAITYDNSGNVQDVVAGSARLVVNETGAGPQNQPSVRTMVQNSFANDSIGNKTTITFMMVGLEIDPNGGGFMGWFGQQHPNLIFTFENQSTSCCGGPWGSWMSTIFSTAGSPMGQIATMNNFPLGTTTGNANGAWVGLQAGVGHPDAPIIRGLAWIDAGYQPAPPYGNATLQTANDGVIDLSTDPTAYLDVQSPIAGGAVDFYLGIGPFPGTRPLSFSLSPLLGGYGSVHVLSLGPVKLGGTVCNAAGQATIAIPVPNNPVLKGLSLIWQAYLFTKPTLPVDQLSNPVLNEIR